jgi:hypothetical protein
MLVTSAGMGLFHAGNVTRRIKTQNNSRLFRFCEQGWQHGLKSFASHPSSPRDLYVISATGEFHEERQNVHSSVFGCDSRDCLWQQQHGDAAAANAEPEPAGRDSECGRKCTVHGDRNIHHTTEPRHGHAEPVV